MHDRLLVAIDDSASTPFTLSYATALARLQGSAVHVVYVNQFLVGGRGFTASTATEASNLVDGAVRQLQDDGIAAGGRTVRATCFNVPRAVVAEAEVRGSAVIVVGSRRRRGLGRLFGHNMRERITSLTPLPVLTAPAPLEVPGSLRSPLLSRSQPASPLARR
jgi:nucleotide-binding universal stress UspA family protein